MLNMNGNVLAAVDVETTGLLDAYHDLIQVAVLPLDHNLDPLPVAPFYANLRPLHPERADPEAMKVNGLDMADLMLAPSAVQVADHFDEWFERLNIGVFKKLVYLTQNAPFDVSFLRQWLGIQGFEKYFTRRGRDTMFTALSINDKAVWRNQAIPFSRVGLKDLCQHFGIPLDNHHDALADCIATAKVYRELLRFDL